MPTEDDMLDTIVDDRRYATRKQQSFIQEMLADLGMDLEDACQEAMIHYPGNLQDLPMEDASELIEYLKNEIELIREEVEW